MARAELLTTRKFNMDGQDRKDAAQARLAPREEKFESRKLIGKKTA
jgi:hypothetical protein